jgi:branched-chain amino acid transport system substrate-binding protein
MKPVFLCIVLSLLLVACAQEKQQETIKVGVLTPLSGDLAFIGENTVRSAQASVKALGYEDVELVIGDAGQVGGGKDAISAYRKMVDQDHVTVIIDIMASDSTLAVTPFLESDKVVMITPATGGENIDTASEYMFRNGPSDIKAGTQPAEDLFAAGYTRVALITDNAAYTLDIVKHFKETYKGTIVIDEIITPSQTDYRSTVSKVLSSDYDAILINSADGVSVNYLYKQLHELGNTKPIYTNFLGFNGNTIPVAGVDGVEGVYIYLPEFDASSEQTKQFFTLYKSEYNAEPTIPFHTTGTYDAVRMAVEAQRAVGSDGEAVHDYLLAHIQNWQGMNGIVSFDSEGNTQTGFVLNQIQNGTLVLVQ